MSMNALTILMGVWIFLVVAFTHGYDSIPQTYIKFADSIDPLALNS